MISLMHLGRGGRKHLTDVRFIKKVKCWAYIIK